MPTVSFTANLRRHLPVPDFEVDAATVRDGVWHETGDRVVAGQPPVRIFEMTLRRIGDSQWPAAGAIPAATSLEGVPK